MEKKIVTILKQDHFGRGITYVDGKICFVKAALPQEKCEIIIDQETKNFMTAHVNRLLVMSPNRTDIMCPYFQDFSDGRQKQCSRCGGCQILHQTYESQLSFKQEKVREIMKRYAQISPVKILPIIPSPEQFFYRNKVIVHIENNKLGYFQEKSNQLIEIGHCPLLHPKLNDTILLLKQYITNHKGLTSALIRYGNQKEEVLLSVEGNTDQQELISFFQDKVATLIYNDKILYGKGKITSCLFHFQFQISKDSFFQVNEKQTETLYQIVLDTIKEVHASNVLDLYCGTGTIGMLLSPYVKKVIGVEVVKSAIINAIDNKKQNRITNISFLEGKVEEHLDILTKEIDTIIVDPPRSGLHASVISSMLKINATTIIYVSCDPMTLARDIHLLQEKYQVEWIQPVDMFPNTYHVECVCVLNRY